MPGLEKCPGCIDKLTNKQVSCNKVGVMEMPAKSGKFYCLDCADKKMALENLTFQINNPTNIRLGTN